MSNRWALDAAPEGTALETFVQWKGTDLCMDAYCQCGRSFHVDGFFAHQVQCPTCGLIYELSTRLLVRAVPPDEVQQDLLVVGE